MNTRIVILPLLTIFLLLPGCGKKRNTAQGTDATAVSGGAAQPQAAAVTADKLQNRAGIIYVVNGQDPFSGSAQDYYANGQIRWEATITNGYVTGLKRWYENGVLELSSGLTKGTLEDVNLDAEILLYTRTEVLDGEFATFDYQARKQRLALHRNGVLQGVVRLFFADGTEIKDPQPKMLTDLGGNVQMELVWVAPGTFRMGSESGGDNEEWPGREVWITWGYWMGKYEVTQGEWERVMGDNPSQSKGTNLPVETVSWYEAVRFGQRLTETERLAGRLPAGYVYRLPTEAEWEYAARGGARGREMTYAGSNNVDEVAWHSGNSERQTRPVGGKAANELGLHDMSGNVWEWVHDWDSYPRLGTMDPVGPPTGSRRVYRGGSWFMGASLCRVASRDSTEPTRYGSACGFRVVLAPQLQ